MATAGPQNDSTAYDPYHSRSGSYSDSEDDQVLSGANSAREPVEHDRELIREEEERENLLSGSKSSEKHTFFGRSKKAKGFTPPTSQRARRKVSHKNKKQKHNVASDEEGELMYEMEEGGPASGVSSRVSTSSVDLDKPKLDLSISNKVTHRIPRKAGIFQTEISCTAPIEESCFGRDIHHGAFPSPCLRSIQNVPISGKKQELTPHTFQWHRRIRSYHYPYLTGRFSGRLLATWTHSDLEFLHYRRRLSQVHAPKLSERHFPKPLHPCDRPIP